jgi:prepilin signal peptidase PulO-like enzyme (type II secretory pathway)
MFQRMIDDIKDSVGNAMRMTYLVAAAAVALFITTSFLCAAAFIAVLHKYGPVAACLCAAALFFVVALIAAGCYLANKRQAKARAAKAAKSAMHSPLADPMMITAGLQIVRAIGIKRLIPILAIAGVALGVMAASRRDVADQAPAE